MMARVERSLLSINCLLCTVLAQAVNRDDYQWFIAREYISVIYKIYFYDNVKLFVSVTGAYMCARVHVHAEIKYAVIHKFKNNHCVHAYIIKFRGKTLFRYIGKLALGIACAFAIR